MCRPCLYTAHVYRDDVTLNLGRYYIYVLYSVFHMQDTIALMPQQNSKIIRYWGNYTFLKLYNYTLEVNEASFVQNNSAKTSPIGFTVRFLHCPKTVAFTFGSSHAVWEYPLCGRHYKYFFIFGRSLWVIYVCITEIHRVCRNVTSATHSVFQQCWCTVDKAWKSAKNEAILIVSIT
jgi:hypothetical protein